MNTSITSIKDAVLGRQRPLQLAGTMVPKFEQSVIHAAARDGTQIINQVHAVEDPEGLLLTEFFSTEKGRQLLEGYDAYLLHVLSKRVRS
jgi:hypothetical protein